MRNIPSVTLGLVAVSRDCFPVTLSESRRARVAAACRALALPIYECPICVETEQDALRALEDLCAHGINALCVYLGNFGPETPTSLLLQRFGGVSMAVAAAEDGDLIQGRGDAYCGLLNLSYNLNMRRCRIWLPDYPVGTPEQCAVMISEFLPTARAVLAVRQAKVIAFGPRPRDFVACNAPLLPFYDLGVEVEENSELDLYEAYRSHAGDKRIPTVVEDMQRELGDRTPEDLLRQLAQYELTLLDWVDKDCHEIVAIAGKCWPAFQTQFGFVPCYVNSRLTAQGIPVACEVDMYGALSELIGVALTRDTVTLLDINNTVPDSLYRSTVRPCTDYGQRDVFMGFHCGNTPACKLRSPELKNQLIMARTLPPEVTRGTLEGTILPGDVTLFRLHGTPDGRLSAYIAQGEVLDAEDGSFGSRGIIAVPDMGRFYRHVLLEHHFPHHCAVAFSHCGRQLHTTLRCLGVEDIYAPLPTGVRYPTESMY